MNDQRTLQAALEQRFGLRNLRPEWLRRQAELSIDEVVGPICRSDICQTTTGTLPWNLCDAHSVQLNTKVLVQIEDVINIANSDPRSTDAPRVLQLTLTDGHLDFVAVELEPLRRLSMMTVPGTKLVLQPTALVRRGRLFLTGNDFTFLGSPASNLSSNIVWGEAHAEKVNAALCDAGLPNPKASTFDAIARDNGQLPPDMGGIADAARIADEAREDEDDDDFWAQAVTVADSSEAAAVATGRTRLGVSDRVDGDVTRVGASVPTPAVGEVREVPPKASNSACVEPVQQPHATRTSTSAAAAGNATMEQAVPMALESTLHINDIPDMPVFESDRVPFGSDSDFEDTTNDVDMRHAQQVHEETEDYVVAIPKRPFCRLEDVGVATTQKGRKRLVCRAYVPKLRRKPKATQDNGGFIFSIPFDDGSKLCKLGIRDTFFGDLRNVAPEDALHAMISSEGNSTGSGVSNPFLDSPTAYADTILKYTRGIHGFIQIECTDDNAIVTAVAQKPPGGLVSILIVQVLLGNSDEILKFSDHVRSDYFFIIPNLPYSWTSQNRSKRV